MAAVASTILAIVFAILAQAWGSPSNGAAFIYSVIFPPGFYIFTIRAIAGFEVHQIPTTVLKPDPDNSLRILPLIIAAVVRIKAYLGCATATKSRITDRYFPLAMVSCPP